jgi:hypothetical protein
MTMEKMPIRVVAVALGAAVCLALAAPAAANPPTDPCGVVTEAEAAHAFGFAHAKKTSKPVQRPGNSAGVVRVRCEVVAWDGPLPANKGGLERKLADGEMATLRIESWVPDVGGQAEAWRAEFPAKLKGLLERAHAQFLGGRLDGSTVALPKEGVPHAIAFAARAGSLEKARALWWDRRGTILSVNALQRAGRQALPSLRRLAGELVRPFFKG